MISGNRNAGRLKIMHSSAVGPEWESPPSPRAASPEAPAAAPWSMGRGRRRGGGQEPMGRRVGSVDHRRLTI